MQGRMKDGRREITHSVTSCLNACSVCVKVALNSARAANSSRAAVKRAEMAGSRWSSTADWRDCKEVLVESYMEGWGCLHV